MKSTIKLQIEATKASMQPPIGPILGQYGIPRAKFCQDFNEQTKVYEEGTILSVKLKLYKKKVINIHWSPLTRRNLKKLQHNPSEIISRRNERLKKNIIKKDMSIMDNVKEEERVVDKNNKLLNVSFRQKFERWMKYNKYRKMKGKIGLNLKQRTKNKRKKKRVQILEYNYMYIEDVYNLACGTKTIGNIELDVKLGVLNILHTLHIYEEKEKRAIKEILGSLTSMQTYIIQKNAKR